MIQKKDGKSDNSSLEINERNVFLKIWLEPTKTIKYILSNCGENNVILLLVLGGIASSILKAVDKNSGDNLSISAVLGLAVVFGGGVGWIGYQIYAWALSVTGKWINGSSNSIQFRIVIAWSLVPFICTLFLLIPELLIFGDDLFKNEQVDSTLFYDIFWVIFGILDLILWIWAQIILVKGIAVIQNFSIGKAILNLLLPIIILIILIVLIGSVFKPLLV